MNILAKNNKLNHRYSYEELIIKQGIFMLPNSLLILNDSSKIVFRDSINKIDEDLNLKIINLVNGSLDNLINLPKSSIEPTNKYHLVNKLYIDNLENKNNLRLEDLKLEIETNIFFKIKDYVISELIQIENNFNSQFIENKNYFDSELLKKQNNLDEYSDVIIGSVSIKNLIKIEGNINITSSGNFISNNIINALNYNITGIPNNRDYAINKGYVDDEFTKMGFITTLEAQGLLSDNSFPFSFNNNAISNTLQFGIPIPFKYTLKKLIYINNISDTVSRSITIDIIHYNIIDKININLIESQIIFNNQEILFNSPSNSSGSLIIRVIETNGFESYSSGDLFHRLSIVYNSNESLNNNIL